ncbi:MAG TPA: DUF1572 family protein [Gemmatimonadaceae bacterium]|nr:DUF1572 family protein [Gemmatimonadaceae bacterium]
MLISIVHNLLRRDLAAVRRSVEAYPDAASLWEERAGLPNTGGTLALHLAGNLQHYIGAVLGHTGYVRDRDSEFSRRGVPRGELIAGLDAAARAIDVAFASLDGHAVTQAYPEQVAGRTIATDVFLVHLAVHLTYHLGQLDYHRRVVTGDRTGVNAVAVRELPELADS